MSEKFADYGERVREQLVAAGLRAELDVRNEKLGYRIREAQVQKVPYMLVVGAKEEESGQVSVRLRTEEDLGAQAVGEFVSRAQGIVRSRSLEL